MRFLMVLLFMACKHDGDDCPPFDEPLAQPGDPIDGDNYANTAAPFFADYCIRCHSEALTSAEERHGAPLGRNWDVESSVRSFLPEIRNEVGVLQRMPPSAPQPTCEERERIVRWLDADAP